MTYALRLVAMSQMLCGYRNSQLPLWNINAEEDSTDIFFFTDEKTGAQVEKTCLWSFSWLVAELRRACNLCFLILSSMFFLPNLAMCCPK